MVLLLLLFLQVAFSFASFTFDGNPNAKPKIRPVSKATDPVVTQIGVTRNFSFVAFLEVHEELISPSSVSNCTISSAFIEVFHFCPRNQTIAFPWKRTRQGWSWGTTIPQRPSFNIWFLVSCLHLQIYQLLHLFCLSSSCFRLNCCFLEIYGLKRT